MSPRRKDIALIASIALNVFLIGAAMTVYALHQTSTPAIGGQRTSMRAAAMSLDDAHRTAFTKLLHGQGQTIQAETRAARAIRDEAWASLATAGFDPTATKRKLAEARELNVLAHRTVEDAVVDFAVGLAPAQRVSFSRAMQRTASRPRPGSAKERPNAH
jgi:uncharacterized membrane protein